MNKNGKPKMEKIYHVYANQKKASSVILISDKIDLGIKKKH